MPRKIFYNIYVSTVPYSAFSLGIIEIICGVSDPRHGRLSGSGSWRLKDRYQGQSED